MKIKSFSYVSPVDGRGMPSYFPLKAIMYSILRTSPATLFQLLGLWYANVR